MGMGREVGTEKKLCPNRTRGKAIIGKATLKKKQASP